MQPSYHDYLKLGTIHFMSYPEVIKGEGPVLETLEKICGDDDLKAVEVTWIKDDAVRTQARDLLKDSGKTVAYGAQPRVLVQKLNLNSFDDAERKTAVDDIKVGIDEAAFIGATGAAVLSGPNVAGEERGQAMDALVVSLKELSGYAQDKGLKFALESFDFDIDKSSLIGPSTDAVQVAQAVRAEHDNFGLLLDLSHFPIQYESTRDALSNVKEYLTHVHFGNCIMKDKEHPAYGDQHPRLGVAGGENDVPQIIEFLKTLFDIGYLGEGKQPIVSFEVKPMAGEDPDEVLRDSKEKFKEAWGKL